MATRLLFLNGPPGIGKSTIAERYIAEHPLPFCLDIDQLRRRLGQWQGHLHESGPLARDMAIAMARTHLLSGHDVVVPQFLSDTGFIQRLEELAAEVGAHFCEFVLLDDREQAVERFQRRAHSAEATAQHREAAALAGGPEGLRRMYDALRELLPRRPAAKVIPSVEGRVCCNFS